MPSTYNMSAEEVRQRKGTVTSLDVENDDDDERWIRPRKKWNGRFEFILTIVGYAVGLGNIWRFPYLSYQYGGGTFLIPYFIMLAVVGLPLFYLELLLGQFSSLGPITVWKASPFFKGIGAASCSIIWMNQLCQIIVITWAFYYLFASFNSVLPWTYCSNDWNTDQCMEGPLMKELTQNETLIPWLEERNMTAKDINTPSEEYFYREVLRMSDGLESPGIPVWQLTLCLLLTCVCCFLALVKGIDSLGKVMYVVTTFPYVMMTALVIRGATLEGAAEGITAYMKPNITQLGKVEIWSSAATQTFYTLGACSGGLFAMASFNPFHNNILRDALIVPVINALTSIYAGFAIFSVLGFMAHLKGVGISEVAAEGPGLVFVVYPEGLSHMPAPPVWSVLFFVMLITLGYSSVFSMVETVFIAVMDSFPEFLMKNKTRPIIFRGVCLIIYFLISLPMVTNGGFYLFYISDKFVSGFPMLFVGLLELVIIIWVYGYNRLADDIAMMLGKRPNIFFRICWSVLAPAILTILIIMKAVDYTPITFEEYVFSDLGNAIGWLEVAFILGWVPVLGLGQLFYKAKGSPPRPPTSTHILDALREVVKPEPLWGPASPEDRTGRYAPTKTSHESISNPMVTDHVLGAHTSSDGISMVTDHVLGTHTSSDAISIVTYHVFGKSVTPTSHMPAGSEQVSWGHTNEAFLTETL